MSSSSIEEVKKVSTEDPTATAPAEEEEDEDDHIFFEEEFLTEDNDTTYLKEMLKVDDERPLWFLTLTQSCNLKCVYCGSDENFDIEDLSPHPREISYDKKLLEFFKKEEKPPVICFYGGEPLLRLEVIYKVMDEILGPDFVCDYVFQTNGLLLDRVDDAHLHRVRTILVSVDGDAATTDKNRGAGTYAKAIEQVRKIRERGYTGDVIARMTVGEWSTIEVDVLHLCCDLAPLFDHVHWQLDVLWDSPKFARWDDFLGWRDTKYNPGITRLAQRFADELRAGRVLGIVPFLGLVWSILNDKPATHIRCSSGFRSFNVTTGGLVTSCPIAAECAPITSITEQGFNPVDVHGSVELGGHGRCRRCDIYGDCGGRCLYASRTNWWRKDGFNEVCVTVRHLSKVVREIIIPAAKEALAAGKISLEQLHYPPFNNTTEIIP